MRKILVSTGVICLGLALMAACSLAQQDKSKRPSPPATATFDLGGGKSITIDYSSPRMKGRKSMADWCRSIRCGGLAPMKRRRL